MPDEKNTIEMAKVPDWAIALTEKVTHGFARVDSRLDTMEANLDLQKVQVVDLTQRVSRQEQRADTNSMRAKMNTDEDLAREAAIAAKIAAAQSELAKEREAREALAKEVAEVKKETSAQTQILGTLEKHATGLLNNRAVQALGGLFLTAASIYLGTWIAAHQPKAAAAPPVPAGYQLVPVDGGAK